ncbi:MAG: hypothetical protein JWL62_734, partial [Hyphomicrobiales bacterium]|nr:hypothetical protein [Hyphomicrobiales bacterium]
QAIADQIVKSPPAIVTRATLLLAGAAQ